MNRIGDDSFWVYTLHFTSFHFITLNHTGVCTRPYPVHKIRHTAVHYNAQQYSTNCYIYVEYNAIISAVTNPTPPGVTAGELTRTDGVSRGLRFAGNS